MSEAQFAPEIDIDITLRPATPDDADVMARLVSELAAYQDQAARVTAKPADFRKNGFGPDRQFDCIIAERDGAPVGLAIFYPFYSTWDAGRGLFIHDLIVDESVRGTGVGIKLVSEVARSAKERGCNHLQLNVVHANPARNFYDRFGFTHRDDLLSYRLIGKRFDRLADGDI